MLTSSRFVKFLPLIYWLQGCFLIAFSFNVLAGQVSLVWNPSTSTGVTGYRLYYGQSSNNYSAQINVGNVTSYTLTGLQVGQTYYFAVTAYNSTQESGFSNEISKTIADSVPGNLITAIDFE